MNNFAQRYGIWPFLRRVCSISPMRVIITLTLCLALACRPGPEAGYAPLYSINPILGDASWINAYGELPGTGTPEKERIACHLMYAADVLSSASPDHLSNDQRANRAHLLRLLRDYAHAGVFPENTEIEGGRRPCFIDDAGNICAVGYLVEQTLGREVAEQINTQFQYAAIDEMNLDFLGDWMARFGVTLRELAIIQPTYEFNYSYYTRPSYYVHGGFSLRGMDPGYPTWTVGTTGLLRDRFWLFRFTSYDLSLRRESLGGLNRITHFNMQLARTVFKKLSFRFGAGVGWYEVRADAGLAIKPQFSGTWPIVNLTKRMALSIQAGYGYDIIPSRSDVPVHSNHDVFAGLRLTASPF